MNRIRLSLGLFALTAATSAALGEEPVPAAAAENPAGSDLQAAAATIPPSGSADDVNYELNTARPRPAGLLPNGPVSILDRYFNKWNANLKASAGIEIGMAYTAAWQRATDGDIKDAAGGDLDLFGRWRALGTENAACRGIVGINMEYRHDIGNDAPADLGPDIASLWGTTNGFDRQDPEIVQLWWEQHFNDKLVVTAGKLDADTLYNKNRYQNDNTAFMSEAFSSNPARSHPGNGLGVNALFHLTPQWYVTGGFQDANGAKDKSGFHTWDEHEYFGAGEIGWTPKFEKLGSGTYRATVWHMDERDDIDTPNDWGIALSCEQEIGCGVVPFFRAAWSDGDLTGVSQFVCGGVGLEGTFGRKHDLTGIGLGWGEPEDSDPDPQLGGEIFHRFQLSPDIQLTFGYQYIVDPSFAASSDDDPVGVFEVRVRITF
jgi:hypothetical protein